MNYLLLLACVLGAATAAAYAAAVLLVFERGRNLDHLSGEAALLLRLMPAAAAIALSLGLVMPAFVRYEPMDTRALPGTTGLALGLAGLVLLMEALARGLASWWATGRLVRQWRGLSAPLALEGAPAPCFALRHPFPVVALVGIVRPRLFVAGQVVEALTPAELRAVLTHEGGHLAARDNLKRLFLRFLPALGWRGLAARLEARWEGASEMNADRWTGPDAALDLASALLKVARLAPPGMHLGLPVAAFHSGEGVAGRVQALLDTPAEAAGLFGKYFRIVPLLAALAVLAASGLLPVIHTVSETLVHLP
jgi:Zn-dependent protease with chaperone function